MDDTDGEQRGDDTHDEGGRPAVRRADDPVADEDVPSDPENDPSEPRDREAESIEDLVGPRRTLEPTVQAAWMLRAGVSSAVVGVLVTVAFAFLPVGGPWVGGAVFTALFLLGVVFAVLRYRAWSFEVRRDSLYLERGVFRRVRTVVPYVRIQHVDASRGPIERVFGLATTVVYTAGSRGADVSIPGLTPADADDLQDRLKRLAIAAEGEDAV